MKLFISYTHDSLEHSAEIANLSDRLRRDGLDCMIDQYESSPSEGWPMWMDRQLAEADFVLVICTGNYLARFYRNETPGVGLGAIWESGLIAQDLHDRGGTNEKYIPIIFSERDKQNIPRPLRSASHFNPLTEEGYKRLIDRMCISPESRRPVMGKAIEIRRRNTSFFDPITFESSSSPSKLELLYEDFQQQLAQGIDTSFVLREIRSLKGDLRSGPTLSVGDVLADRRFALKEEIGHGGFGVVWKAWDREDKRYVAIKVLHGTFWRDETVRARFFRGAAMMSELEHDAIVSVVVPHCVDGDYSFFAMEYVSGPNLRDCIKEGRLSRSQLFEVARQIGDALSYAHSEGIMHRDVKPSNILLTDNGRVQLTDFDLAAARDSTRLTITGQALGTFDFSAPEVLRGSDATPSCDVYSLALTLLWGLSGGGDIDRGPRGIADLIFNIDLPIQQKEALRKATSSDPSIRPQAIETFMVELFGDVSKETDALNQPHEVLEAMALVRRDPTELYKVRPHVFEGIVTEILSAKGWRAAMTPPIRDGGYDIFAECQVGLGLKTSWLLEVKKYAPERKIGVDIIRGLYGIKSDLRVANVLLVTSSSFTKGVGDFQKSRYDVQLCDGEMILKWINEYEPRPDGEAYFCVNDIPLAE